MHRIHEAYIVVRSIYIMLYRQYMTVHAVYFIVGRVIFYAYRVTNRIEFKIGNVFENLFQNFFFRKALFMMNLEIGENRINDEH